MMTRRSQFRWSLIGSGLVAAAILAARSPGQEGLPAAQPPSEQAGEATDQAPPYVAKSAAQLRRLLTPLQYRVTQQAATEPAFRNKYWNNRRPGLYRCIVCELPVFDSSAKFKSGTGWPSFFQPIAPDVVGYRDDWHYVFRRTEVHCSRCKAHFGHVFDDGPRPTGKRYCMNSASLKFEPRNATSHAAEADSATAAAAGR